METYFGGTSKVGEFWLSKDKNADNMKQNESMLMKIIP